MKISQYCFNIDTNKWGDFQTCISVTLMDFSVTIDLSLVCHSNTVDIINSPLLNKDKIRTNCYIKIINISISFSIDIQLSSVL